MTTLWQSNLQPADYISSGLLLNRIRAFCKHIFLSLTGKNHRTIVPIIIGTAEGGKMKITRKVIEEITGIKARRIEFYKLQNLYDDLTIGGRGTATEFKERHVVETYLVNELRLNGIELTTIKAIISKLRKRKLFMNDFDDSGRLANKGRFTDKRKPKMYAVIFDRTSKVALWRLGRNEGKLPEIEIKKHSSVLIVDITKAYNELAKL